jgi:hypothetical protein
MAVDDIFQVVRELIIECYTSAAFFENLERFGEQTRAWRIGGEQFGDDTGMRLDVDLIAAGNASHESFKVVYRFSPRDVNDGHATIIPWVLV